ncbi:hypothetical protein ACFOGG_08990 [Brenneria rubrifaciens]
MRPIVHPDGVEAERLDKVADARLTPVSGRVINIVDGNKRATCWC